MNNDFVRTFLHDRLSMVNRIRKELNALYSDSIEDEDYKMAVHAIKIQDALLSAQLEITSAISELNNRANSEVAIKCNRAFGKERNCFDDSHGW